jgi:hypothetical protein
MNNYNRTTLYKERADSFVKRTVSLLERIDFNTDFDSDLHEAYETLLDIG